MPADLAPAAKQPLPCEEPPLAEEPARQPGITPCARTMLWAYRLLLGLGYYKRLITEKEFRDDSVARALGLGDEIDRSPGQGPFKREAIIARLRKEWQQAEAMEKEMPRHCKFGEPVKRLAARLALDPVEEAIVEFRLAAESEPLWSILSSVMGRTVSPSRILSCVLAFDEQRIQEALAPQGMLIRSGVVEARGRKELFLDYLSVIESLADLANDPVQDVLRVFRSRIAAAPEPTLTAHDYPQLAREIAVLKAYLSAALRDRRRGVNVLLYGEPGSGKTEFARMIAREVGSALFEVAVVTRWGAPLEGHQRLRAFRLAQALLERTDAHLLFFDEVDEVFRPADISPDQFGRRSDLKGLFVSQLETNPVPAIWVCNSLGSMDRALRRRFDFVLRMDAPPRCVRRQVLDKELAGLAITDAWKNRFAEHEQLVPALVVKAGKIAHAAMADWPEAEIEAALSTTIGNSLQALGLPREPRVQARSVTTYRPEALNCDCDIAGIAEMLRRQQSGRLCFYGPPGTGKTAFAQHLARAMDRPLLVRRASDLLSKWVGENEHNIAAMFAAAREEKAVLLLDEADSFLQERGNAQRSWEVTLVNEMLTQMENFEGVFLASTNLIEQFDCASLRRFDCKIRFDYLRPEQAWLLFQDTAATLGLDRIAAVKDRVLRIGPLTPGDFAVVIRQARLRPVNDPVDLLARLGAEQAARPDVRRTAIGFLSGIQSTALAASPQ
ncbi:Proteasome-associated ATPase [Burkholderiales bacterium]|nr:Proteasome-associated ATPase [Burkholderiales bacterium]